MSFVPKPTCNRRLERQYRHEPPPDFPLTFPFSGCVHHLSSPNTLSFSTFKIAVGRRCTCPSIHFHCACSTHKHTSTLRHKQKDTDTDKGTQTQTHAETRKKNKNKHLYSRRWSWPSFHRGGSSDPALRRATAGPGSHVRSRLAAGRVWCRLTFSQVTVLEVKLILETPGSAPVTEFVPQNPGICISNRKLIRQIFSVCNDYRDIGTENSCFHV